MIGRRDFCFFRASFSSFRTQASILDFFSFLSYFVPSVSMRECLFTLLHEFHISHNHTEWYVLLSDSSARRAQKRIRCGGDILSKARVTLHKLKLCTIVSQFLFFITRPLLFTSTAQRILKISCYS